MCNITNMLIYSIVNSSLLLDICYCSIPIFLIFYPIVWAFITDKWYTAFRLHLVLLLASFKDRYKTPCFSMSMVCRYKKRALILAYQCPEPVNVWLFQFRIVFVILKTLILRILIEFSYLELFFRVAPFLYSAAVINQ